MDRNHDVLYFKYKIKSVANCCGIGEIEYFWDWKKNQLWGNNSKSASHPALTLLCHLLFSYNSMPHHDVVLTIW